MGSTSDLKRGAVVKYNNDNYFVEEVEFRKPGKGGAFFQVRLRNVVKGNKTEHKYRSGESIDFVRIESRTFQFLYKEADGFVFMNNDTYDQVTLPNPMVGDQEKWMKENDNVTIMFEGETPIVLEIPQHVNLIVTFTEPGLKGDTATNASKPATLETGATLAVPLFVNEGDLIRVDTNMGTYIERVNK